MPDNEGGWTDVQQDEGWQDVAQPDAIAQQSKAAAIGAGVKNPGVAPISTPMPEGGNFPARKGPNGTTLRGPLTREESNAGNTGGMEIPEALLGYAAAPGAAIGSKLANLGRMGVRAYAGSKLGGYVGRDVGKAFHNPEAGEQVGSVVGGAAGPFLGNGAFARVPFLNRAVLSNEELAGERAAMKVAQRGADISAGLRHPITPKVPKAPEPSMIQGTPTNAMPPASTALQLPSPSEGPISTTGNAQPTFLREIKRGVEAQDKAPLRPTIGTPEEWKAFDQRMKNLKAEASDAGTFSAARGKVGKKLNYQERIGKAFE